MSVIIAWFVYFLVGRGVLNYLFPLEPIKRKLFARAFIISSIFVFSFHFISIALETSSWYERGFTPPPGILTIDGLQYHENGRHLAQSGFNILTLPHLIGWTIAWQFIIGINYFVFGVNVLIPKVVNIFIFSLTSVAFSQLGFLISNNRKVAKRSYYLFLMFLPLLYYATTLLREVFLAFLIVMCAYTYIMALKTQHKKWYLLTLSFSIVLLFTRFEYFLFFALAAGLVFVINKKLTLTKKIVFLTIGFVLTLGLLSSPLSRITGLYDIMEGGGRANRMISTGEGERVRSEGYTGIVKLMLSKPLTYAKHAVYGTIQYIADPLPTKWLSSNAMQKLDARFFFSLFNAYHYILLPALFFGIYFKYKQRKIQLGDILILSIVVLNVFSLALTLHVSLRYSVPIFPLLLLYTAYGVSIRRLWINYIPFIVFAFFTIIILFTLLFDVKTLVN